MIVVTQGHEKGIGLEVFFKSLALGPKSWTGNSILFAHKKTVSTHLKKLNLPGSLSGDSLELPTGNLRVQWLPPSRMPQSSSSLNEALSYIKNNSGHVLFTLPTTKDDLRNPKRLDQRYLGHTEFLRAYFGAKWLGMFFTSPHIDTLLLTDHVPLSAVSKQLTNHLFETKLTSSLRCLRIIEPRLKRAFVAGLNPHAGEGGLLGREEIRLEKALRDVSVRGFSIKGFYSGDTLHFQKQGSEDLLVYLHHDQGLAPFKILNGAIGANVTLGLPFIRLSVDHGTAFSLYGKNIADHRGAYYCLRKAMSYQELEFGKNTNYQGQGS